MIAETWERCQLSGTPVAVLLVDLDHFKTVNDRFGHAAGDDCLRRVAAAVRTAVTRPGDLAARYGGEEFAVLLPNATAEEALAVAQGLRRAMRTERWTQVHPELKALTVSVGICAVGAASVVSIAAALGQADAALYRAKNRGRDRIEMQDAQA